MGAFLATIVICAIVFTVRFIVPDAKSSTMSLKEMLPWSGVVALLASVIILAPGGTPLIWTVGLGIVVGAAYLYLAAPSDHKERGIPLRSDATNILGVVGIVVALGEIGFIAAIAVLATLLFVTYAERGAPK